MGLAEFFKGKGGYQVSDHLINHPLKDKYFYRLHQFAWLNESERIIWALDKENPRTFTFDPWPQEIFLNATGLKTIFQFTVEIARKYNGRVPRGLEETIIEETSKLINDNIIAISDQKVILPDELLYIRKKINHP